MHAGAQQIGRIDKYVQERHIPVFYAFYNPVALPYSASYPPSDGRGVELSNAIGCRVQGAGDVHGRLGSLPAGQAPTIASLRSPLPTTSDDAFIASGWRLEAFIADEVLRCRKGALFEKHHDPNLDELFYGRSAPITAAIAITIDIGGGRD